jgi:hypothetical protein
MTTPNLPPINFGKDDINGYTPKVFGTSANFNFDNPFDPANFDTEKLGLGLGAISTLDGASALSTGGQENGVRSQTFAYMNYLRSLCLAPYNVKQLYNASNYVFDSTNGNIYCSLVDLNIGNALTVTSKWTNTNINIANLYKPASETVSGVIKISTSAQVTAGTDNETAMTPAKLFEKLSAVKEVTTTTSTTNVNGAVVKNGYTITRDISTGAIIGKEVFGWVTTLSPDNGVNQVFPITFTALYSANCCIVNASPNNDATPDNPVHIASLSLGGLRIANSSNTNTIDASYSIKGI